MSENKLPENFTFADMTKMAAGLVEIETMCKKARAARCDPDKYWYGEYGEPGIKKFIYHMVGWGASNELLCSAKCWDCAVNHLYYNILCDGN